MTFPPLLNAFNSRKVPPGSGGIRRRKIKKIFVKYVSCAAALIAISFVVWHYEPIKQDDSIARLAEITAKEINVPTLILENGEMIAKAILYE